ncbi:unnamed protein product [Nezara viridula]|uniref:Uncharacterized protein n=1 Tax=Nezara viridula TaxID=85310 RepID=A0A9P0HS55_NEZVI|nr:unnamed protein product [Nezara viridula]
MRNPLRFQNLSEGFETLTNAHLTGTTRTQAPASLTFTSVPVLYLQLTLGQSSTLTANYHAHDPRYEILTCL